MKNKKRGLSTFSLKLIALILMTVDHIGYLCRDIPFVQAHYTAFRSVGRIAAPIFLFCLVQGCMHTRSKPKYALRLYLAGVLAGLFHTVMNRLFGSVIGIHHFGNIFFTFSYVVLYALVIEGFAERITRHKPLAAILYLVLGLIPTGLAALRDPLCNFLFGLTGELTLSTDIADALCPMALEYGRTFVVLGVLMYFAKEKNRQLAVYAAFSVLCFLGHYLAPIGASVFPRLYASELASVFFNGIQYRMILALPFLALYNGQKGRSMRYLFYVYYPTHVYLLVLVNMVFGK